MDLRSARMSNDMNVMRRKYEKPQKGNPHQLTVNEHVWPWKGIARFANADGVVSLFDKKRQQLRMAKPNDDIFCAKRVWDQRAEGGYMKGIEDAFQELASQIIAGTVTTIDAGHKEKVDAFCALWKMRADYRAAQDAEISFKGVTGADWTKDEEERFEKAGTSFFRKGGKMPARMLYGIRIQFGIDAYVRELSGTQWGIIRALDGHFVVQDYPTHAIIPITPTLCLSSGGQTGTITRQNLAEINCGIRLASVAYFFAQDLAQCP